MPTETKDYFYLGQILLGGVFLLGAWYFVRGKAPESNFKVREADRPPRPKAGKPNGQDDLANARLASFERVLLPGIRLDGAPHELLGISPDASEWEIQQAYRELMKRFHPDKVGPIGSQQWKDAQGIAEKINWAKREMLARRAKQGR
jgi:DnaJ-domain-containing protein 1